MRTPKRIRSTRVWRLRNAWAGHADMAAAYNFNPLTVGVKLKGAAREMYESMSKSELEDLARTKHEGKPEHKSD